MGLTESIGAPIARRLGWARTFVSLTFVATLLGLGLANIALRATWHEVEDGVLWVTGPQGVTAAEVAPGSAAAQAGVRPGDVLLAIGDRPVEQPSEVLAFVHAQSAGTRLRYTVLRLQSPEVVSLALAPLPQRHHRALLRPRRRGHLHAAGRRRRAVPPSQRRSHAALLLAVPGVFRRHHVLVQRPARSTRLVLLLDRRRLDSAAAAAVPALHAGLSRTARAAGSARRWGARSCRCSICRPRCSVWPASSPSRARRWTPKYFIGVVAALDRFEPLYLSICLAAGLVILIRAFAPRALGDRAAPAALDRVGHGARRAALRAGLRGAVRVWRRAVAADGAVGDPAQLRAARLCLGHRPLPADGRRGDPQAHARLGRGHRGDPGPLRRAAQRRHRRVQRQRRQSQLGDRAAGDGRGRAAGQPGEERDPGRPRPRLLPRPVRLPPRAGGVCARPQRRPRSQPPGRAPGHAGDGDAAGRSHGAVHGRRRRRFHAAARRRLRDDAARAGAAVGTGRPPRGRPRRRARRSAGGAPFLRRRDRVLARLGAVLLRALHRQRRHHRHPRARASRQRRAAEQRGHGAAGRGGRPGRHGARERPPLQPAPREGRRARSPARVQRQRPAVARQRPGRLGSGRTHPLVEPRAREALRRAGRLGRGPAAE